MHFSIIIPAKNEQANIGRCLDSVFRVDWDPEDFEVMVIDNGSSDDTQEIARWKGARVHYQPGLTISGLRNFGARRAAGEILAYLDADCTVPRNWLREASRYLSRPEVLCFGSPPGVPESATWVQSAWYLVRRKPELVGETDWLESMNLFVRRDAFLTCGGFDESLVTCEDYDLSLRMKKVGQLVHDSRIVATHHGEAATVGHFFRKERWRGKSNISGVLQHGVVPGEIPSLAAPALHCLLLFGVLLSPFFYRSPAFLGLLLLMALWQCLLLWKSFRKQWPAATLPRVVQLFWLLNVYLVARGVAVFQGK
jgi:GT2 family glycosyltransferase